MIHIATSPHSRPSMGFPACLRLALCLAVLAAAPACQAGGQVSSIVLQNDGSWQASLAVPASTVEAAGSSAGEYAASFQAGGIEASALESLGQVQLALDGTGGLLQVRRLIFNQLSQLGLAYQPGAQLALEGDVQAGEALSITLEANPSTGYAWSLSSVDVDIIEAGAGWSLGSSASTGVWDGAPQPQVFQFTARKTGRSSLVFTYGRSWEPALPGPRLEISASRLADLADLSLPDAPLAPLAASAQASTEPLAVSELPARWDWREHATLPPPRNQGSCGSCWAFATVGALETNIAIQDGRIVDLSEQYLVSCNTAGWNCVYGGGTAHGYHYNQFKNPPETSPGAVLEVEYPYTARDDACAGPNPHAYRIKGWNYVGGGAADVAAIKQAIYTYGPVKASVCAGSVFMGYDSGIYATDEVGSCNGSTNHAIVLTGWDDTQGSGIWYLRNSWGSGWGEGGYMRIAHGVSNIGRNSSYVDFDPYAYQFFPIVSR